MRWFWQARGRSKGDRSIIEAVGEHIEAHFGPIDWVMHEKESPAVHVDVYVVKPTAEREYQCLITSGMSEYAMPVPADAEDGRFAELILCLPPDWPLSMDAFKEEANYWPVRLLKGTARYAAQNNTWLYAGHSMHWSTPPKAFAPNTTMTSVLLLPPKLASPEACTIELGRGRKARLWGVFPLHEAELEFKVKRGTAELDALLEASGLTELLDPGRASVVKPH